MTHLPSHQPFSRRVPDVKGPALHKSQRPHSTTPVSLYTRSRRSRFGGRNIFSRRHLPSALCFLAAALVILAALALPLAASSLTTANDDATRRAAEEAARLQETSNDLPREVAFSVGDLLQNPELPTGCESVALTNALLAHGIPLTKTEIAANWLPLSQTDFVNAFMGDPRSPEGHSCMAPAITQAAQDYLQSQQSDKQVLNLTGASFGEVLREVAKSYPVLAWCTIDLESPRNLYLSAAQDGRAYELYDNNHCVTICGYNLDENTLLVSDPLRGFTTYDLELFATSYFQMGSQAVVVK